VVVESSPPLNKTMAFGVIRRSIIGLTLTDGIIY